MTLDRTQLSLGISTTQLNNAWESSFKTPINNLLQNTVDLGSINNYLYNFKVEYTSSSSVTVSSGVCRNTLNNKTIRKTSTTVVSINTTGAGGLDTGTKQSSVWYYVWIISKADGTTSAVASLSSTDPVMPATYLYKRLVGVFRTDGSSNILPFYILGNGSTKTFYYDSFVNILAAGTSTTFTNISVTSSIPTLLTKKGIYTIHSAYNSGTNATSLSNGYLKHPNALTGIISPIRRTSANQNGDTDTVGVVECDSNGNIQYKVDVVTDTLLLTVGCAGFILEL